MPEEGETTTTSTPAGQPAPAAPAPAAAEPAAPAPAETPGTLTTAPTPAPASGAPEKYELKLPDGSHLGDGALDRTAAYARKQGLSNEEAQELLNRENSAVVDYVESVKKQAEVWAEDSKADSEIGGDNLAKNCELAKRALDKFGSEALRDALNESGFGNHPEVVRVFSRIGKAMSEDQIVVPGTAGAASEKTAEETFYGETTSKPTEGE